MVRRAGVAAHRRGHNVAPPRGALARRRPRSHRSETMSAPLRIVVTGQMAQYPLGGVTWFYLHYVLGFARLGHDVWYVEDSGQWPYNPTADGLIESCDDNVNYLQSVMDRFGLSGRWAYKFPWQGQW